MDKREIRFDGWKVDFDSGEISRDGNTHRLQDQPLQILEELVKHARRGRHPRAAHRPPLAHGRGGIRHRPQQRHAQAAHRAGRRRRHPPIHRDPAPQGIPVHRRDRTTNPTIPALPALPDALRARPLSRPAPSSAAGHRTGARPSSASRWGSAASSSPLVLAVVAWRMPGGCSRAPMRRRKTCRRSWCCRWST